MKVFDFTIDGPPVSAQARNRARLQAWKTRVREAAKRVWPTGKSPFNSEVTFVVTYFYSGAPGDVDNIIKPIQDALSGLVYDDDSLVADTSARKRRVDGAFRIAGVPEVVAIRLSRASDFLWVRVTEGPEYEELL